jgi:hypothetical protein
MLRKLEFACLWLTSSLKMFQTRIAGLIP